MRIAQERVDRRATDSEPDFGLKESERVDETGSRHRNCCVGSSRAGDVLATHNVGVGLAGIHPTILKGQGRQGVCDDSAIAENVIGHAGIGIPSHNRCVPCQADPVGSRLCGLQIAHDPRYTGDRLGNGHQLQVVEMGVLVGPACASRQHQLSCRREVGGLEGVEKDVALPRYREPSIGRQIDGQWFPTEGPPGIGSVRITSIGPKGGIPRARLQAGKVITRPISGGKADLLDGHIVDPDNDALEVRGIPRVTRERVSSPGIEPHGDAGPSSRLSATATGKPTVRTWIRKDRIAVARKTHTEAICGPVSGRVADPEIRSEGEARHNLTRIQIRENNSRILGIDRVSERQESAGIATRTLPRLGVVAGNGQFSGGILGEVPKPLSASRAERQGCRIAGHGAGGI